ncbi:hypothetical protein [Blastococcus sp. SYSU D00820]
MACPSCGSTQRDPIAPGFWQCTGQVPRTAMQMVPDEGGPRGPYGEPLAMRPQYSRWSEPCGHRYAEGAPGSPGGARCSCGTYSIGRCADCGQDVCGDDSVRRDGRRICRSCIEAAARRAEAEEAARAEAERTARARETAEHDERRAAREASSEVLAQPDLDARRRLLEERLRRIPRSTPWPGAVFRSTVLWFVPVALLAHLVPLPWDAVFPRELWRLCLTIVLAVLVVLTWAVRMRRLARLRDSRPDVVRQLAALDYERGCGDPACGRCYTGTLQPV